MRILFLLLLIISLPNMMVGQEAAKNKLLKSREGKDQALFFAVNDYGKHFRPLENPIPNVYSIAEELKTNYGFKTRIVENPTFDSIELILNEYKQKYASDLEEGYPSDGQLLVFFSGHGVIEYDQGFFLPSGAEVNKIPRTGLSYEVWRPMINTIPCKHILVMIDACFSGYFDPHWKGKPGGTLGKRPGEFNEGEKLIAYHQKYKTRLFFTSATNTISPDKSNFVKKFLEGLLTNGGRDGILTSSELFAHLHEAEPKPHRGAFEGDEAGSSFIFTAINGPSKFQYDDDKIELSFLHLNDTYEISALQGGKVGGLSWVGTFRKMQLQQNKKLLTVHAGDFLSPSLLGTMKIDGKRVRGKQMVEVLNALGVDLVTFGNHEFDLNEEELQERINESKFNWLTGNIEQYKDGKAGPFYKEVDGEKKAIPKTYIWEVEDEDGTNVKVGIFAVTLDVKPTPYVRYDDYFEAAKKSYEELKDTADFVVGLVHMGREDLGKLARMLPDVPLIMAGHDHDRRIGKVGNVTVGNADANAKTVLLHNLVYDKINKTVEVVSEFYPKPIAKDPELEIIIKEWEKLLLNSIPEINNGGDADSIQIIYNAKVALDGREISVRSKQTNLGEMIAAGIANASTQPVDLAFINGGSIRLDDYLPLAIQEVDIYKAIPYGGKVIEVEMTGTLLAEILNAGLNSKGMGGYLQWYNVAFDESTKEWLIAGKPLNPEQSYWVGMIDFLLSGYEFKFLTNSNSGILNIKYPDLTDSKDLRRDVRQAVIAYLKGLF